MRTAEELRRVPPSQMTGEEYIAHLVHNYLRLPDPPQFGLLDFTGMCPDEYAEWIMHGTVPARVIRVRDAGERQLCELQDWYRRDRERPSRPYEEG